MRGDPIVYCNLPSPVGDMIAGATNNGLCFLEWHDRGGVDRIRERVVKRYRAELTEGSNTHLKALKKQLAAYFKADLQKFTVPMDIHGTAFELSVWEQLLTIPYGVTCSYGDMAKALGNPGASRAVGRANGANYLAIVIPCHRVIESTGKLRGYGGGLWRKKFLLELESGASQTGLAID